MRKYINKIFGCLIFLLSLGMTGIVLAQMEGYTVGPTPSVMYHPMYLNTYHSIYPETYYYGTYSEPAGWYEVTPTMSPGYYQTSPVIIIRHHHYFYENPYY